MINVKLLFAHFNMILHFSILTFYIYKTAILFVVMLGGKNPNYM